jgi:integrase
MTESGVRQMMERRGLQVGIEGLHPHRFRHQFAHQWLAAGVLNKTSCVLRAGDPGRCLADTRQAQQTSGHVKHISE